MVEQMFAAPDVDAPAREAEVKYLKMEDLMGRHVIIVPKQIEQREGERGTYETITADVIVLDGRKTEKVPTLPRIERDFWVSGYNVVAELRQYVGTGTPVLGFLTTQKKAYWFDKADPDVEKAKSTLAAWEQYESQKQTQEPPF